MSDHASTLRRMTAEYAAWPTWPNMTTDQAEEAESARVSLDAGARALELLRELAVSSEGDCPVCHGYTRFDGPHVDGCEITALIGAK